MTRLGRFGEGFYLTLVQGAQTYEDHPYQPSLGF